MSSGAIASILSGMNQGSVPVTQGIVEISQQQADLNKQILVEMFALKAATEMQEAAALRLIQSAMGLGQNLDILA